MKIKRQKLLALVDALQRAGAVKGNSTWQFTIARNLRTLRDDAEAFQLTAQAVELDRVEMAKSRAEKDASGNPIMVDDRDQFGRASKRYKLSEAATKELTDFMEAKNKELKALLEADVEISLCAKLKTSDIPEALTPADLEAILDMVEDTPVPAPAK